MCVPMLRSISKSPARPRNTVNGGGIICPKGRWMETSNAALHLGIAGKKLKTMKSIGVPHMAFERGDKVEAPLPYRRYEYVYFLPNCNDGWEAMKEYDVSLADWCKVCLHLSNRDNWTGIDESIQNHFEAYTGLAATDANIELAFNENVLISAVNLPQKSKKEPAKIPAPPPYKADKQREGRQGAGAGAVSRRTI